VIGSGDPPLALKMSAVLEGTDGRGDCRGRAPLGLLLESRLADRFGEVLLLLLDVPPSLISDCSIWMDSKEMCQGCWSGYTDTYTPAQWTCIIEMAIGSFWVTARHETGSNGITPLSHDSCTDVYIAFMNHGSDAVVH